MLKLGCHSTIPLTNSVYSPYDGTAVKAKPILKLDNDTLNFDNEVVLNAINEETELEWAKL